MLLILLSLPCCREERSSAPTLTAPTLTATAAVVAPQSSASVSPPDSPSAVRDAEVTALLDRWQRTQNEGDFEGYATLFAARFMGTKRAGPRVTRFDRKGWLEDRGLLFAKPFSVGISDPRVVSSGDSAVVEFTQRWSSATYSDVGTKRIVVTREADELRIAAEDMLESRKGSPPADGAPDPRDFAFVFGHEPVLLLGELKNLNAVTGHPKWSSNERASRPIAPAALPAEQRSLIGEQFALYDQNGVACEAEITELFVQIALEPHFGAVQRWDGAEGGIPASETERALSLWGLSTFGGRFLAARLAPDRVCEGALWARSLSRPPPVLWRQRWATV